jgi:hypothetical protein
LNIAAASVKLAANRNRADDRRALVTYLILETGEPFLMEMPQVRHGLVKTAGAMQRVVAFFPNSAPANMAVQLLTQLGVPNDHLGITPPEQIEGKQGMILSIACPDETLLAQVESICRQQGAKIHRQRA